MMDKEAKVRTEIQMREKKTSTEKKIDGNIHERCCILLRLVMAMTRFLGKSRAISLSRYPSQFVICVTAVANFDIHFYR